MSDLKMCPFCGGEAKLGFGGEGSATAKGMSFVRCEKCGAMGAKFMMDRTYSSDEKAIEAWNKRVEYNNTTILQREPYTWNMLIEEDDAERVMGKDEAIKAQRWTPVEQALPSEEYQCYLVTSKCYDEVDVFLKVFEGGQFGLWDGEKLIVDKNVVAWMELPEPYKGAEND